MGEADLVLIQVLQWQTTEMAEAKRRDPYCGVGSVSVRKRAGDGIISSYNRSDTVVIAAMNGNAIGVGVSSFFTSSSISLLTM